jgi:glutamate synthase (NADPH/NADH) small chain
MKYRRSYAIKEGGEQDFSISTTQLTGNGSVQEIHWMQNSGRPPFDPVAGTEESHPAGLVLLAMGFLHPEGELLDALGVEKDRAATPRPAPTRPPPTASSPPATRAAASR